MTLNEFGCNAIDRDIAAVSNCFHSDMNTYVGCGSFSENEVEVLDSISAKLNLQNSYNTGQCGIDN
ncbi:hypothetical protein DERP_000063 [Dermatophagoides pteronyssinus]|uniref:Uncharacterized protein n=1 Tax=Dermatophagoides pteronyssinus TaxID=6956 RepID=A0ABQ8IZ71_DERPT|nr:hypothetical protein DERP_000063 [Dermatophagoides pteronyssinus]